MPENTHPNTSADRTTASGRGSAWIVPVACVVIGVAYLLVGLSNDDPASGFTGLFIMLAYGCGLLVFRRRAEAVALLSADATDERQSKILLNATATSGQVLILVIVAGMFWSMATDNQYVGVFTALSAVGGATFILSTVWHSRRG